MKNKGFSLIELLIVIALMGIVYGIYFFTTKQNKTNIEFSLENIKEYISYASKEYGENLELIYNKDKNIIYLTNSENNILKSINFNKNITQYLLKDNENLEVLRHNKIDIDGNYFEPTFRYKIFKNGTYTNMILNNSKNEWLYFDSYFTDYYYKFINESELINFIKKKDYFPINSGKPE